ncbi:methyl-accepting chemotaxis protein [Desulfococcaceae bacterium HSG7]|nr:methyl-accepting chemotaxis protein [Desulfococcaceae bacterium HSG7]
MSIKSKLILNAIFTIGCLAVIGSVGFFFTNSVANVSLSLFETQALPIIQLNEIEKKASEVMIHLTIHTAVSEPDIMAQQEKEIQEYYDKITSQIVSYNELIGDETNSANGLSKFEKEWKTFREIGKTVLESSNEYAKEEALALIVGEGYTVHKKALSALEDQVAKHKQQMELLRDKAVKARRDSVIWITVLTIIAGMFGLFVGVGIMKSISSPVALVINGLRNIAQGTGDLTMRLDLKRQDEIGELAGWFDQFVQNLQKIIKDVADNIVALNSASGEMSGLSEQLSATSRETDAQSVNVADAAKQVATDINVMAVAAEEMSINAQNVSSGAEQMSQNMNSIASSIEEMSVTIHEVSGIASQGADIAIKAGEMSGSATNTMEILGGAAKEIGNVTEVIKRIAEQTNLLALNATIEAASAGNAGKGFTVVANEIKELANQSARAAEDIAERIQGVQANTEEAIKVMADVSDIINNINESSMMITDSVEQQTQAANEISGNVQQANTGVNDIASSIAEIAKGANEVAQTSSNAAMGVNEVSLNIQGVSKAAGDTNSGAQQVNIAAGGLAKVAGILRERVINFKM